MWECSLDECSLQQGKQTEDEIVFLRHLLVSASVPGACKGIPQSSDRTLEESPTSGY